MTRPYQQSGESCRARPERCPAALTAEPRPCEGEPDEVRVSDQTGQGASACLLHGAVLLASLTGGRVFPGHSGHASAIDVGCRAREMRPFDGVWTGPGVQRITTLDEAMVFPSSPDDTESRFRSPEPGNTPGGRWGTGRRYQAGHALRRATNGRSNGARGTRCKEVATP